MRSTAPRWLRTTCRPRSPASRRTSGPDRSSETRAAKTFGVLRDPGRAGGDRLSVGRAACSAFGLCRPPVSARAAPDPRSGPAEMQSVVREMLETRAGWFVSRFYREERYRASN